MSGPPRTTRTTRAGWTASGVVEAPVEKAWKALLDALPDLPTSVRGAIVTRNSDQSFITSAGKPGEGKMRFEIDRKRHQIAIEGEWWYRGVYSVEPHANGSLLVYRVYNIAPGIGWWAVQSVQGQQHARTMPRRLEALLGLIGQHLGCKVVMLTR
ncbi:MAG: hypothetical protein IVW55_02185 [Chloroflexi bacterium]|nr:hypothetical protein [Chloroflexota bacterium]